jgi:hypothetical protein
MTGEPSQWIDLLTPTRGTHILPGSNYEIKWNSGNISGSVNLDLSFDGGETFNYSIAQGTPNDGSFVWNVPNDMKEGKVVMRVSDISGSPYDVNWNFFSIKDPEDRSYGIVITNPNGGEELVAGSKYTIFWKSFGFDGPVHVYVSSNNGRNWETIAYNRPATGLYVYTVHNIPSDQYKIRVAAAYDDYPVDTSDATFKVIPSGSTPSVESVTLYNPVGGEHWKVNSVHKIGWESYNFDGTLTLDFSTDNGLTWKTLTYDREPRGMLTWPVPDKVSDQCLMKLYDPTDNIPMAITRQPFAIISDKNEPQTSDDDFAMHFDGEDDFVEIASHPSLNVAEQFTIEFWLKTNDPYQSWTRILEKGSWDEYYIGFYGTHGKIHGALRTDVGNSETSMTIPIGPSNNAISPNSWYHIAATFDGAKAKLFINGIEQTEKNVTVSPRDLTRDLIIGAVKRAASSWGYIYESNFKGTLDELRIWNIPRSSVQILDNMYQSIEPDETGLVACYSFNEGSGQTLHDHSPYANHGRLGLTPNEDDSDPIWVPSDRPLSNKSLEKPVATETESIVDEYALLQNYPNPFNSETTIAYTVPSTISQSKTVKLEIYDLTGRRIKTLVDGIVQSGYHVVRWDGRTQSNEYAASGIYFYKLVVGDFKQIKRLVLIK